MMNEQAREALAAAALRGHRQIVGTLHDSEKEGDCALGILHLASHNGDRKATITCSRVSYMGHPFNSFFPAQSVKDRNKAIRKIAYANDILGWDFLTIARKCNDDDAVNPTQEDHND